MFVKMKNKFTKTVFSSRQYLNSWKGKYAEEIRYKFTYDCGRVVFDGGRPTREETRPPCDAEKWLQLASSL
jgi:hypothetical protein